MILKTTLGSQFYFMNKDTKESEEAEFKHTIYSHEREKIEQYYKFTNASFDKFIIVEEEIDKFTQDDYDGYKFRVLIIKNFYINQDVFTEEDNKKYEDIINLLNNEYQEGSPIVDETIENPTE